MLDKIRGNSQSWVTKIIFGLIIITFVFFGAGTFMGFLSSDVAEVNGEGISAQTFGNYYARAYEAYAKEDPSLAVDAVKKAELKDMIVDELISRTLVLQEARRLGLVITPQEVYAALSSIPAFQDESGKFDSVIYREYLKKSNQKEVDFEQSIMDELLGKQLIALVMGSVGITPEEALRQYDFSLEQRVAQYILFAKADMMDKARSQIDEAALDAYYKAHQDAFRVPMKMDCEYIRITPKDILPTLEVSNEEIAAYYDEHKADTFTMPEEYKLGHITVACPPESEQQTKEVRDAVERAREVLDSIEQKLRSGVSFAVLQEEYADVNAQNVMAGELGWVPAGKLFDENFENEVAGLRVGEVSGILRSPVGFHLIAMEDRKASAVLPLSEARESIREALALQKAQEAVARIQADVDKVLRAGGTLEDVAAAVEMKPVSTGLLELPALLDVLQIVPEEAPMLEKVAVGETALSPFTVQDGSVVLKVLDAQPERILPLDEVKEDILATLAGEKAAGLAHEAALEARAQFTGSALPDGFKDKAQTTAPLTRNLQDALPLHDSQTLVGEMFRQQSNDWMAGTFDVREGTVIARLKSVQAGDRQAWDMQRDRLLSFYVQIKQNAIWRAYTSALVTRSSVKKFPKVIDQISI